MPRDLTGVLEAVLAGVVVVDSDGRVEFVNSAACRILEMSAESARGAPVENLLGPGHALARLARTVLATGGSTAENACPVSRRHHAGLCVDVSASPLFDEAGCVDGVALMLRDSTIQQTLQKMVAERESLTAFGTFAAGIAHEVKNPLGGIRGAAEILASRSSDPKTHEAADLIVREVDRIAALVDDLMVFARGDELRLAPTNIHRILDDVLDLLAVDPLGVGVSVERVFDPSIPEMLVDPDRLMQVFLNLARNALQALERKGTLSIETRLDLDHRLRDRHGEPRPTVLVVIADTGPGMPPEVLEKLAMPFFTTRPGGTGLGVAVARHWVARHDGTLVVESAPGEGTRVRVALPLRVAP